MKKINNEQKKQVIELRKRGFGYKRIANKIDGLNRDNVRDFIKTKWFAEKHPDLVKINRRKRTTKSSMDKNIIKLRKKNWGYGEIANRLEITRDKVVYVSRKNGLGGQRGRSSGDTRPEKPEYNCNYCGVKFQRNSHHHVYCSDNCRYSNQEEHSKVIRLMHVKECRGCELSFVTMQGNREYCTVECRQEFYARERETNWRPDSSRRCVVCRGQLPKYKQKVCSDECFEIRRVERNANNRIERNCQGCGEPYLTNDKRQKFCSTSCYGESQRIYPMATCEKCGEEFVSKKGRANRFCDRECFLEHVGGTAWTERKSGFIQARNETHIRRAKRYGVKYDIIDIDQLFEDSRWVCGICNKPVDRYEPYPSPKSASLDHIIPLSKNGTHTTDNVQLAHLGCNRDKYDSI